MESGMSYLKWGTADEIKYVSNIGQTRADKVGKVVSKEERVRLLKNYLKASEERVDWGSMDKGKILRHTRALIFILDKKDE